MARRGEYQAYNVYRRHRQWRMCKMAALSRRYQAAGIYGESGEKKKRRLAEAYLWRRKRKRSGVTWRRTSHNGNNNVGSESARMWRNAASMK